MFRAVHAQQQQQILGSKAVDGRAQQGQRFEPLPDPVDFGGRKEVARSHVPMQFDRDAVISPL